MADSLLTESLRSAMIANQLVSIDVEADSPKFIVGHVLFVSDDFLLISGIDSTGAFDGFVGKFLNDIVSHARESDYLNQFVPMLRPCPVEQPPRDVTSLPTLLEYLVRSRIGVSIKDRQGFDVSGVLLAFDEHYLQFRKKEGTREDGGIVTTPLTEVSGINFCEPDEILLDEWIMDRAF